MLYLFEKFWANKFIVVYHWLCLPETFWYLCQCRRHSQRWILYSRKRKQSVGDTFWTKILKETNSIWFSMKLRCLPVKSKPNFGEFNRQTKNTLSWVPLRRRFLIPSEASWPNSWSERFTFAFVFVLLHFSNKEAVCHRLILESCVLSKVGCRQSVCDKYR